ncbi:MAG: alkaline phosphatase, partial [Treponema sp.]|nr:alkaline phosphatase [Treponema sp.]
MKNHVSIREMVSAHLAGAVVCLMVLLTVMPLSARGRADDGSMQNNAIARQGQAKYVFLFIGDGMAMAQISSTEVYATARSSKDISITRLDFTRFPVSGLTTTYDAGTFITDSASAITAIATGNKTLSGVINMDPAKRQNYKTIAEYAHDAGMKVGIVSSVTLDHATPAGFFAKVPSRSNYYDIAVQMVQSDFEYFAGGGLLQPTGKDRDQRDVIQLAGERGYTYVNDKGAFNALRPGVGKVLAVNAILQDSGSMPYELDRSGDDLSLADYTRKGIELLDNPQGFFMMVEGGKIDWACHANDAGAAIHDVLALDNAIKEAVAFAQAHPGETLIIV